MRPVFRAAGDHAGDGGRQLFFSSNGAEFGFICRDVQLIAADRKIHARIAYGEIAQHIVFIHQRGFIFSIALVILQGIGVCSNCAGIIGGKGRDRMVSHHIFPQFAEDRFGRRAISRQAVDDSLFICCPQLVVGNEPDQCLRSDVLVDGAAAVLGAGFHVISQGESGVNQRFLFFCKGCIIIRNLIPLGRIRFYPEFNAVRSAKGPQIIDPHLQKAFAGNPSEWGRQAGTEGISSTAVVDHGDVAVCIFFGKS